MRSNRLAPPSIWRDEFRGGSACHRFQVRQRGRRLPSLNYLIPLVKFVLSQVSDARPGARMFVRNRAAGDADFRLPG
jgi:hypothetical protein